MSFVRQLISYRTISLGKNYGRITRKKRTID